MAKRPQARSLWSVETWAPCEGAIPHASSRDSILYTRAHIEFLPHAPDCRPVFALVPLSTAALYVSLNFAQGFNYPPEAGYALDPHTGPRFYMLETLYVNPRRDAFINDNSGLRFLHTEKLRTHDAGILSIGIDPNWRHIIPPGQSEVVSEGHCITECTGQTVPNNGINMFAVIMHTHELGKKVRLRQIRGGEEMSPIAADGNYDPKYQEYRRLQRPAKVYPVSSLFLIHFFNIILRFCNFLKFKKN